MSLFSPRESGNPDAQRYIWLNVNNYTADMIRDYSTGSPISQNTATWSVTFEKQTIEWRGISFTITLTNKTQTEQPAPYLKIDSGMYHPNWNAAGGDSVWRHVRNYTNHDSYGLRMESVSYPSVKNPATDYFGNKNAIYGINWFAPCLTVDNYAANTFVGEGLQMMSVSTNYPYPFKIYGEFDASTLKAYFRIDANVDLPDVGIIDKFQPGEVRSWKVWLRFENYNNMCLFDSPLTRHGSPSYRKVAALRSYEPYFLWYWDKHGDPNHGPRVSGRIYGVKLAGPSAPKSYFNAKDNPRRYFLFTTQDKINLNGALPLPGQSYVNPQNVTGWKELLNGIIDVATLKTYGYKAAMLFNVSGWGNNDAGGNPSYFTNLPINLRNTLSELKKWETDNSFRIIFAADNAMNKINLGSYSDAAINFDNNNPQHVDSLLNNYNNGGLKSVSGLSMLDLPLTTIKKYVNTYLESWRSLFGSISFVGENRQENSLYDFAVPSYIDRSEFLTADYSKGGRDWFLDMLMQGADPWVFMPLDSWYADYGNSDQTRAAYDAYAQYIENKHQVIPVTIGRIVKSECLYPKKLDWKDDFVIYSSITPSGNDSVCRAGDGVLNRKICLPDDLHKSYTSNSPAITNMLGLYQFDAYYDWSMPGDTKQSWVPCSSIGGELKSMSGDSLLWLYQDDKLQKAKQTLSNNLQGIYRPGGAYIPASYASDIFHNFELSITLDNGTNRQVAVGFGLEMYDVNDTRLVRSSPGSGLQSRTLRNWWIWVQDQVNPGWSTNKTVDQQSAYLQQAWADRWLYYMQQLNVTIRSVRPNIRKIGFYGAVPENNGWRLDGLNFGKSNPEQTNTASQTEMMHWDAWIKAFDFLAPSLYLFQPTANYEVPLQITDQGRKQGDPIQERLFYLLCLRDNLEIGRIANKQVDVFAWPRYLRGETVINNNIGDFLTRSVYTAGCQGVIWWAIVGNRQATLSEMALIQNSFYDAANFINARVAAHKLTVAPPDPITIENFDINDVILSINPTTQTIPGYGSKIPAQYQSATEIAKYGKYRITSIGGTTRIDTIEGFGLPRYTYTKTGAVGDKFPVDYAKYEVVAIANSVTGTVTLPQNLTKYDNLEITIRDPSFTNVGYPHTTVEDTFEWVNSGMPSHLSQVHHANVVCGGIGQERLYPSYQELTAPVYQAKFIVPKSSVFYDKVNSTIDYSLYIDSGNKNLSLPYPNAILYLESKNQLLIGGYGGVIVIDTTTNAITKLAIDTDKILQIKDMKQYENIVYILDDSAIYKYDVDTGEIVADITLGLPKKLYSIISIHGKTLAVGGSDGIYARQIDGSSYVKVLTSSSPITQMISPDAGFAVSDNSTIYSTTDGYTWSNLGKIQSKVINRIVKYKNKILVATNTGLYQDNGSFYSGKVQLQLLNILGDLDASAAISVNDIYSTNNACYIALGDGRYVQYTNDFAVVTSKLDTVHRVVKTDAELYLFGGNKYQITSETFVRRLATGAIMR